MRMRSLGFSARRLWLSDRMLVALLVVRVLLVFVVPLVPLDRPAVGYGDVNATHRSRAQPRTSKP